MYDFSNGIEIVTKKKMVDDPLCVLGKCQNAVTDGC